MNSTTLTEDQRIALSRLYLLIAEAMPVQGRDYALDTDFYGESSTRCMVRIRGLNELGKSFAKHVAGLLSSTYGASKDIGLSGDAGTEVEDAEVVNANDTPVIKMDIPPDQVPDGLKATMASGGEVSLPTVVARSEGSRSALGSAPSPSPRSKAKPYLPTSIRY